MYTVKSEVPNNPVTYPFKATPLMRRMRVKYSPGELRTIINNYARVLDGAELEPGVPTDFGTITVTLDCGPTFEDLVITDSTVECSMRISSGGHLKYVYDWNNEVRMFFDADLNRVRMEHLNA